MRPMLTIATIALLTCPLFAHPGHGAVESDSSPVMHYLTSGLHIGWAVVACAAITSIGWMMRRQRAGAVVADARSRR